MMNKDLHFFDKNGKPYNFYYDDVNDIWTGVIIMPKISVGLYSSSQIFIMKDMGNTVVYPYDNNNVYYGLSFDYNNEYVDEIFLFDYDETRTIQETSALQYTPQDGPDIDYIVRTRGEEMYIKLDSFEDSDSDINITPLKINIGFSATPGHDSTTYERTLNIERIEGHLHTTVAKIRIFAESEDEDERLKVLCQNLGYKVLPDDSVIFKETDIKEPFANYQFLNQKRKEILLEGYNIYPYIGSYKALVNAIKFYGYDNITIVEFYKNINPNSVNYNKLYRTEKYTLTNNETIKVDNKAISLPNKDYKKANIISLTYNINKPVTKFDENELPTVMDTFDYSLEEAMVKLYNLKRKLDKEFMPSSSKIVDITGEASFFGLNNVVNAIEKNRFDYFDAGINPTFKVNGTSHVITLDFNFNAWLLDKYSKTINDYTTYELADLFEIYSETKDNTITDIGESESNISSSAKVVLEDTTFVSKPIEDLTLQIEYTEGTIEDYDYKGYDSIEWIIKYDGYKDFTLDIQGDISNYRKIFVQLPYTGTYTVTELITDNYNNKSSIRRNAAITVTPIEIEVAGFYYDARPNNQEYATEDKDIIFKIIDEMKGIAKNDSNYDSYFWDNLETLKYKDTQHLTYGITNHNDNSISYFEQLRYIRNGVVVKPYTWACIGVNFSKIVGVVSIKWRVVHNESSTTIAESTSEYFPFMLKLEGTYTVYCTIVDIHENVYNSTKNLFTVKIDANDDGYVVFKKDLQYLQKYK